MTIAGIHARTAYQVPEQLPSIYREDGPSFVEFVKSFYDWLDREGPNFKTRRLFDYGDVDETDDDLVSHFVKKYMHGMPTERFADKRFVIKHVLDVYRSKGSLEGLKLLFRLVYGETPSVYVPSKDVLKASDGIYRVPRYLEVTFSDANPDFAQTYITGSESGATAIVEDFVTYRIQGREVYVMYLSNVVGDFAIAEKILTPSVSLDSSPYILGSLASAEVTVGVEGSSVGSRFTADDDSGSGLGGVVRVTDVTTNLDGLLSFELEDGGFGYTIDTPIYVVAILLLTEDGYSLMTEDDEFIDFGPGSGASLEIGGINGVSIEEISLTLAGPYEDDAINGTTLVAFPMLITEDGAYSLQTEDGTYSILAELTVGSIINDELVIGSFEDYASVEVQAQIEFSLTIYQAYDGDTYSDATILYNPILKTEDNWLLTTEDGVVFVVEAVAGGVLNDDVTYSQWEETEAIDVGEITSIVVNSLGSGWQSNPTVIVRNDFVYSLQISDGDGGFWGDNASIGSLLVIGEDFTSAVKVIDSGFGYADGDLITCSLGSDEITVRATLGAVGYAPGDWVNTQGMLNADKYVHDSFYYQEYSYDVQSTRSLDDYEAVIKSVYHPVGSEVFGTAVIGGVASSSGSSTSEVTQS